MHLYRPKVPVCVAMGCSGVALAIQLAAVIGTGWMVYKNTYSVYSYFSEEGLFRYCKEITEICYTYDERKGPSDWAKYCQLFSILSLGAMFSSCLLGILHIFRQETQALTHLAAGVNGVAVVYIAVEVGVFAGETKDMVIDTASLTVSYGYCFYLSIVAGVLSVVTAILYVVGRVPVRQ
ncbi:hypothetical protein C0Q70_07512 [Pomacea canaliculata]|uniref:Claudin n=1 Tax=Pomacea canaliculata TaxID=400727 RepID=A0A2T7PFA8_POMCA|nr:uncharacterized protein LOC112563286 [Pomacea canaliculata]PVD32084.1 hypothetical protein C0Q70_07512 [Pomacea canaliculata]